MSEMETKHPSRNETEHNAKHVDRKWWQFTISDLLLWTTIVALLLAPLFSGLGYWVLAAAIVGDVILFCFIAGACEIEE